MAIADMAAATLRNRGVPVTILGAGGETTTMGVIDASSEQGSIAGANLDNFILTVIVAAEDAQQLRLNDGVRLGGVLYRITSFGADGLVARSLRLSPT